MSSIQWTTYLSVGIDFIDDQHKELFNRINILLEACNNGKGKEVISGTFDFLQSYVVQHFQAEEAYMTRYNYPAYPEHKVQHDRFIEDVLKLKSQLDSEGASGLIVIQTNRVVVNWLNKHIRNVDTLLGEFLKSKI
ncbi:MAG TPA: bacteriohemerythrin [Bacillota bacterium]|jgi:hemerythrin|nr:bacteriohemerythrin [Bacillota bacterium]